MGRTGHDMNKYVFILNDKGERETSLLIGVHAADEQATLALAQKDYPSFIYILGDEDMLDQFLNNKAYVNGDFIDIPVTEYEQTKAERIAQIRKYYDERFATLDQALLRRRLANVPYDDLQTQYKTLQAEMATKIKAVK